MSKDICFCESYYDDNNKLQNCTCGKCESKEIEANYINELIGEKYNINLVTCGECGAILSHEKNYEGDLKCKHCNYEDEQCYFPDLFY